jgi:hypothetical protein
MFTTDESENLLGHLTKWINPNGWRVLSNPTRPPDPEAAELKTLIHTMQERQRPLGKQKVEETEPPEAASVGHNYLPNDLWNRYSRDRIAARVG